MLDSASAYCGCYRRWRSSAVEWLVLVDVPGHRTNWHPNSNHDPNDCYADTTLRWCCEQNQNSMSRSTLASPNVENRVYHLWENGKNIEINTSFAYFSSRLEKPNYCLIFQHDFLCDMYNWMQVPSVNRIQDFWMTIWDYSREYLARTLLTCCKNLFAMLLKMPN